VLNGSVSTLALTSTGRIVAGGGFTSVDGLSRQRLARIGGYGFPANVTVRVSDASGTAYVPLTLTVDSLALGSAAAAELSVPARQQALTALSALTALETAGEPAGPLPTGQPDGPSALTAQEQAARAEGPAGAELAVEDGLQRTATGPEDPATGDLPTGPDLAGYVVPPPASKAPLRFPAGALARFAPLREATPPAETVVRRARSRTRPRAGTH
jgi:hypothetical protein